MGNYDLARMALVAEGAEIGEFSKVMNFTQVETGARIGRGCVIGPYAFIEASNIGDETKIWHYSHVRRAARIGERVVIGKNVFIDFGVPIGNDVKIQNNVSVYHGVTIEDAVFVGPHVCFTNDLHPRAVNYDGSQKSDADWELSETLVRRGVSIGANATIIAGIELGEHCLIGSGSVVNRSVKPYSLVVGNPARAIGHVCGCGKRADYNPETNELICRENPLEHRLILPN
jgi:acetyltransferase-like isoleucine patch superfamily enzyme